MRRGAARRFRLQAMRRAHQASGSSRDAAGFRIDLQQARSPYDRRISSGAVEASAVIRFEGMEERAFAWSVPRGGRGVRAFENGCSGPNIRAWFERLREVEMKLSQMDRVELRESEI